MTRLKTTAALLGAAALTLSLGACGGGGEYCDLIESADSLDFASSEAPDADAMAEATDKINEIAAAAPSDVKEDWETMASAFEAFAEMGDDPSAMDEDALAQLEDMEAASTNVTENVKEECDIDL